MGAAKNFGSVTLRNSALGSVALGMLVVGAGAMPFEWTVAQPSRAVAMPLVAAPEVQRTAVAPVKWTKRNPLPKLAAVPERQFVSLPVETAAAAVPVGAMAPVAQLPFTTAVPVPSLETVALVAPQPSAAMPAAPRAETAALVAQLPVAVPTPVAPRADTPALVAQLTIAAPAAPTVVTAAAMAQLPGVASMPAMPGDEAVALVAPTAEPIAESAMRPALPMAPVEEAAPSLVAVSTAKPVAAMSPVIAPALSDLIHVDQISALAPMAPTSAAGFAAPTPFSATPYGIAESIYVEQISAAPPARLAAPAVRQTTPAAKPSVLVPVTVTKLAAASKPSTAASGAQYKVTARGLEMNMAVLVNGTENGRASLAIDSHNAISMRLADVLDLVRPLMDDVTFARLNAAGAAQDYVSFATLRSVGLDLRYDAALDRVDLTVATQD